MSNNWTYVQAVILAILPKISSIFSLFGSTWIVIEVLTHDGELPKRHHPYHRLLFAMSVYDILESIWNFTSTWPMPASDDELNTGAALWAVGNTYTCSMQGFFLTLSVAVPLYNALLGVYYMLVIKFQFTQSTLSNKVEPTMHFIAGSWAFGTAISSGVMGLYNNANLWCWIAPYPSNCKDTMRYSIEEANCVRGNNAWFYRWVFYFGPLWLSIIAACKSVLSCCFLSAFVFTIFALTF